MTENNKNKIYNLEERTSKFAEETLDFVRKIKPDHINRPIISQLVRSVTSIGANYMEANGAESKKDFMHKIAICKKECRETKYFLRIISKSNPEIIEKSRNLWQEAQELTLIFGAISRKK